MQSPFEGQNRFLLENLRDLESGESAVATVADAAAEAIAAATGDAADVDTDANVEGTSAVAGAAAGTASAAAGPAAVDAETTKGGDTVSVMGFGRAVAEKMTGGLQERDWRAFQM